MLAMAAIWRAMRPPGIARQHGNGDLSPIAPAATMSSRLHKTQIDQTRKTWADMAKNASTKATMEATCKQTMDATKASLAAYGCSF